MRALMRRIAVHSYGTCLNNRPEGLATGPTHRVGRFYKFYVAIENSLCEDYITEKLVSAVQSGASWTR